MHRIKHGNSGLHLQYHRKNTLRAKTAYSKTLTHRSRQPPRTHTGAENKSAKTFTKPNQSGVTVNGTGTGRPDKFERDFFL